MSAIRVLTAAALAMLLAGCTKEGLYKSGESWCRNAPNCTVNE